MTDPWLSSTAPLWSLVALGYCWAAVYLRALDDYDHPIWVWFPFLFVGTALMLMVNQEHILAEYGGFGSVFEIVVIIGAAALGHSMFILAKDRARNVTEKKTLYEKKRTLETELEEYEQLIERHEIRIEQQENDDSN